MDPKLLSNEFPQYGMDQGLLLQLPLASLFLPSRRAPARRDRLGLRALWTGAPCSVRARAPGGPTTTAPKTDFIANLNPDLGILLPVASHPREMTAHHEVAVRMCPGSNGFHPSKMHYRITSLEVKFLTVVR